MASSTFNEFSEEFKVKVTDATSDSTCVIDTEEIEPIKVKIMNVNIDKEKIKSNKKDARSRKSCLRVSHFSSNSQNDNQLNASNGSSSNSNTRSSFFRLKNIDRPFEDKENKAEL